LSAHPPKPRLALSVGIIGHRPNRLAHEAREAVNAGIAEVLQAVGEAVRLARERYAGVFANDSTALTLFSALAEGADRMAAHAALEGGFTLSAVLPFVADEYERDFEDEASRVEFRELLARCAGATAFCGNRHNEGLAYETAGATIIDNADIVLAVWDGGASAGRGGTTALLERAATAGVPILHVDAAGRVPTRVLWPLLAAVPLPCSELEEVPSFSLARLAEVIDQLLRPPTNAAGALRLRRFLDESRRPRGWRLEDSQLFSLAGSRKRTTPEQCSAPFAELLHQASPDSAGPAHDARERALAHLAAAFGWADALGARYARYFRGAYLLNLTLAALAVLMAVSSLVAVEVWHEKKWPFVLAEVVFVLVVIANTTTGRRKDWHGWWLETREVAEGMRAGLPLWWLAQKSKAFAAADPSWMHWYARAHFRAAGLPTGVFDEPRCAAIKRALAGFVEEQCRYHTATAHRLHGREHRLERMGEVLFGLTLVTAVTYLAGAMAGRGASPEWGYTVTAFTAGLPALGAASYAARMIGDFDGSARRSQRTGAALRAMLDSLSAAPPALTVLRLLAQSADAAITGDIAHWRLSSETRKLAIPG
jgi:hypothetical protein